MLEKRLREIFKNVPETLEENLDALKRAFDVVVEEAGKNSVNDQLCENIREERGKSAALEKRLNDAEAGNERLAAENDDLRQERDSLEELVSEIFDLLRDTEKSAEIVKDLKNGIVSRKGLSPELERKLWLI